MIIGFTVSTPHKLLSDGEKGPETDGGFTMFGGAEKLEINARFEGIRAACLNDSNILGCESVSLLAW
jgi:hypothetical protein